MKQMLLAGVLALGIHGLLFSFDFNWSGSLSLNRSEPRALDMTLSSIPIKTIPKPLLQQPTPILKKKTIQKKKRKKSKQEHILKTPPKKTVQIPDQSKLKEVPKTTPEKTDKNTESLIDSEKSESKTSLKTAEQIAATHFSPKMIHEARPIYRSNPSPKYPRIARIRGYQGNVLLDVLVNEDGKVEDLKIYKSSGYPLLDRAAASSVKQWLFEPGRAGDEKTAMWVRVPIRFELK
jgi:periplasmic protein TonB